MLVLLAACSREKPEKNVGPSGAPAPSPVQVSKPAGEGAGAPLSYEDALNRFRTSPGFAFTFNDGTGELKRPRLGMEEMTVDVARGADRGKWQASVQRNGVVWTKDGQHVTDVPPSLQHLFQRLTIFPDPQKKEGAARRTADGFEFTDANGGDRYAIKLAGDHFDEVKINDQTISIRLRN